MSECTFCDIINEESEAAFVYRDSLVSAFMDIRPINIGHVIIVPDKHAQNLADLPETTGSRLFSTAQKLSTAIRTSEIRSQGINLFLADGKAAGQEVFHVHLHVIPRFPGDGFRIKFDVREPSRSDLQQTAEVIRQHL